MNDFVVLVYYCTIYQYLGVNVRILTLTRGTSKAFDWNPELKPRSDEAFSATCSLHVCSPSNLKLVHSAWFYACWLHTVLFLKKFLIKMRAQVSAQTMNLWVKLLGCHLSATGQMQTKMTDNNIIAEIINRRRIWKAYSLYSLQ